MATPAFILALREKIGHDPLWLTGATAVVLREGAEGTEVLLGRRTDSGRLAPISGIVEPGEEPAMVAEREALEEAGVVAVAERLAWVHAMPPLTYGNGDQVQYLDLVFRCRYVSGEPHPADGEASEVFWRRIGDLEDLPSVEQERILQAATGGEVARFERA